MTAATRPDGPRCTWEKRGTERCAEAHHAAAEQGARVLQVDAGTCSGLEEEVGLALQARKRATSGGGAPTAPDDDCDGGEGDDGEDGDRGGGGGARGADADGEDDDLGSA